MTNLTEKWKKGELSEGWYYVKDIHNEERLDRYFKETDNFEYLEDWEVDEVLAPVPSYELWKVLLDENKRLKHDVGNLGYKIKNQRQEINNLLKEKATLKELLKESKRYIDIWGYTDTHGNALLPQINKALGEE